MDEAALLPLTTATMDPVSRPSSTSTQESHSLQLPGISSIAAAAAAAMNDRNAPQLSNQLAAYQGASPAAARVDQNGNIPSCQNCRTSTTPLWRRDETGSILCNACGLFLKLHNRNRPISLKTDVIKSRNRLKNVRPDLVVKKKQAVAAHPNGAEYNVQGAAAAALNAQRAHRSNGHSDDPNSPNARHDTASMYGAHLPLYNGIDDHQLQQPLPGFGLSGATLGRLSPTNGDRSDHPATTEQLQAAHSSLKTRVDELEVINDLITRRLHHYETLGEGDTQLRSQLDAITQSEAQLRNQLEESHRRENNLKRRLDEVESDLKRTQELLEGQEDGRHKKQRIESELIESKSEQSAEPERLETPAMPVENASEAEPEPEKAAEKETIS